MSKIEAPGPSPQASNFRAYLTVAGATSATFCTVGFVNAFGVFQQYYKERMLSEMSDSDISWIGSVSMFFLYALAPVSGVLVDRIGPKWLLIGGSLGQLVAIFMTSLCTQYYQFFLAQAVLLGASMSFITWPPLGVVGRALPARRGLALGIVIGGSSAGGVIWPVMLERLLNYTTLGFGWVMRIVGFMMIPLLGAACLGVAEAQKPASPPPKSSDESSTNNDAPAPVPAPEQKHQSGISTLLKHSVFIFLTAGLAISYLGLFIPFFYISSYATEIGVSPQTSFYLISMLNAASLFGRVLPGHLADIWGHYNMILSAIFFSAVVAYCWTAATSFAGVIVVAIVYGFVSGAILSLQGACVTKIAHHQMQGTAIGLQMGCLAVTVLVGTPIGGAIVTSYGYLSASMFTGSALLAGGLLVAVARLILDRRLLARV